MKYFVFISIIFFCFIKAAAVEDSVSVSSSPFVWRQEPNSVFAVGEKFDFEIQWSFITVGYAEMGISGIEEIAGRKAYHILVNSRSAQFFDAFYKVRDVNESWMDIESLCSLKYSFRMDENNKVKKETVLFDQEKHTFTFMESKKTGTIPLWVHDVLSAFYFLRTKNISVGEKYSIDAHSEDKTWPLTVKIIRREKVKVRKNEHECFVVEPFIREGAGLFRSKGKLQIWLTADDRKIPVMMRSKISVGSVQALLISTGTYKQ